MFIADICVFGLVVFVGICTEFRLSVLGVLVKTTFCYFSVFIPEYPRSTRRSLF